MGWLYPYHTHERKDLIADIVKEQKNENRTAKSLAHCTRGNVLWIVWEVHTHNKAIDEVNRYILCMLMQKFNTWGYKDLDESMHPYYYSCPEKYLNLVPNVLNQEWRDKVNEYHECRRANLAIRRRRKLVDK